MLLSSLTAVITLLPAAVLGRRLVTRNHLRRREAPAAELHARQFNVDQTLIKPGGLRYVENTGICGRIRFLMLFPTSLLIVRQKPPPACIRLRGMQTSMHINTCISGSLLPATTLTMRR